MVDISHCTYELCEKKLECWRFMAIVDTNHCSFAEFHTICKAPDYDYFYKIDGKKVRELPKEVLHETTEGVEVKEGEDIV
jgi:hypothetical protein